MEKVSKAFANLTAKELQAEGLILKKDQVNLNSLFAGAARQASPVPGSLIVRMDELPLVSTNKAQLQQGFRFLLQFITGQVPRQGKIYCYVKSITLSKLLQHDEGPAESPVRIEVHTNARENELTAHQHLLENSAALFLSNRIGFEYKKAPIGGMVFLLTIPATALIKGSG